MSKTTDQGTLADFLFARISEDEKAARAALKAAADFDAMHPGYNTFGARYCWAWSYTNGGQTIDPRDGSSPDLFRTNTAASPTRLLAECQRKRRLVARLTAAAAQGPDDTWNAADSLLVDTLRDTASVYADHEAFREEWRA